MDLEALLMSAVPGSSVDVQDESIDMVLPGEVRASFELVDENLEQIAPRAPTGRRPLVVLESATRAVTERLRSLGASFISADGRIVSLRAPGVFVEVEGRPVLPQGDRIRNPFSARALGVGLQFLLKPERPWTVSNLARAARVSPSFASRVVSGHREEGLVVERSGGLSTEPALLFVAMAREWPRPRAFFAGRPPGRNETVLGGGPAYEHHGLPVGGRARAYVASRDQLRMLAAATASSPATARMADWEAVLLPLPLPHDFAPPVVVALELAGDPRGREVLRESQLVPWEIVG